MRFSPTKLLHGLLCSTPLLVLVLAACGGGGGSDASLGSAYNLGGVVTGLTSTGLVLRNNGGDNLTVAANAASFVFATKVITPNPYNVTVLTNPSIPSPQSCDVTNGSGNMPAYDLPASGVPAITVACNPAYTIGGTINNTSGSPLEAGLVLQDNLGDNLLIPPGAGATSTFTFSTPLVDTASYSVTVLTQPNNQKQTCQVTSGGSGSVSAANVTSVIIGCGPYSAPSQADRYVYVANAGSTGTGGVSTYTSAAGVLTAGSAADTGNAPYAIAVTGGKFAYVVNYSSKTISGYSISTGPSPAAGTLIPIDMDPVTSGTQGIATGNNPFDIAIHPSGKFAYVANYSSNSVTAYSIDPSTGVLSSIDADGSTTTYDASIPTRSNPISIAITPDGNYAYVANAGSSDISTYSIDSVTGALTAIPANGTIGTPEYITSGGSSPYKLAVDPTGTYLYIANSGSDNVSRYYINSTDGSLYTLGTFTVGTGPHSVVVNPNGLYAYVANTSGNTIGIYSFDGTGALISQGTASTGTQPYAISVDSTGQYLYVANVGSSDISVYAISGGTLTEVSGSPFAAGSAPASIATSP